MRSVRALFNKIIIIATMIKVGDHDQSERVSSKGVGSRLEKLLKTNFIINIFQDFRSHLEKNYILEQIFAERLFLVEHISATVFHKIVFITLLSFSLIKSLSYFIYYGQLEFLCNSSSLLFYNGFTCFNKRWAPNVTPDWFLQ